MEKPRLRKTLRVGMAGLIVTLAGCSSISQNDEITACDSPRGSHVMATPDKNAPNYNEATDPTLLAKKLETQAEKAQKEDIEGWSTFFHNQVVGIGEVACDGVDGNLYLTPKGASLSADYPG